MPLLHWFRKKSRSTEAEGQTSSAKKSSPEPTTVSQATSENSGQETVPDPPSIEKQSASLPLMPLSATDTPKEPVSVTAGPVPTPHFSVAVGAIYAKLPPHLLAPEKPDLTRLIEIAEEDVVIERETQEATVSLSILSLSCPDIFVRPVADSDDMLIKFPVNRQAPITAVEPPDHPTAQPLENAAEARASEADAPAAGSPLAGFEFSGPADSTERELTLRLEPILSNFPPDLEQPSIRALSETGAEIVLPLDVIESQLAHGRVVVSAAMFCGALPNDLKPYFDAIEPTAEIPIPLREIFLRLPPEVIKLREDQEIDRPEATIRTPFSIQAEEDAKRLGQVPDAPAPTGSRLMPDKAETRSPNEAAGPVPAYSSSGSRSEGTEQNVSSSPPPPMSEIPVKVDSERLHAIFMTDETLDLPKIISMVAELPGLRACLLNTADGVRLAGNLDDPSQEQAISALAPELFQLARSKLASMRLGMLETITLYCGPDQISTFVQGKFCLTVLHDNRPFKPGVREKVQAVISELASLSTFEKEP